MPQENTQKIKLLKILEILCQETDEDHPMKCTDLCAKLGESIHIARQKAFYNQEDFVRKPNVAPSTVNRWQLNKVRQFNNYFVSAKNEHCKTDGLQTKEVNNGIETESAF